MEQVVSCCLLNKIRNHCGLPKRLLLQESNMVISPVVALIRICVEGAFIMVNLDEWFFPFQKFWLMSLIYASPVKFIKLPNKLLPIFYYIFPFMSIRGVGERREGGKRTLSTKSVRGVGEGREGGKRTLSTKSVSSEAEELGDETVKEVREGREGGKGTLSTKCVSSERFRGKEVQVKHSVQSSQSQSSLLNPGSFPNCSAPRTHLAPSSASRTGSCSHTQCLHPPPCTSNSSYF